MLSRARRSLPWALQRRVGQLAALGILIVIVTLVVLLLHTRIGRSPTALQSGTASPAQPADVAANDLECKPIPYQHGFPRWPNGDPWVDVQSSAKTPDSLRMRLWCSDQPHSHACRARNMCLVRNSPARLPDGWYLPYTDYESSLIWTPSFNGRDEDDALEKPVVERLWGHDDPKLDHAPLKELPVFRLRTSTPCFPGASKVITVPGVSWLLDWEMAGYMVSHVSHFLRPVLAMFAAHNVSTTGFIPRIDRLVIPSRRGVPTPYQAGLLEALGYYKEPPVDHETGLGRLLRSEQDIAASRVMFKEQLDALTDASGSIVCFESVVLAFEEYYFANHDVCPAFRQAVVQKLTGPAKPQPPPCEFPRRVLYVVRRANDGASRPIANEREMLTALEELTEYDVYTPDSAMGLREQVKMFATSGVVISMHGSQNANTIYMQAGSSFIEILPWNFYHDLMTSVLSQCGVNTFALRHNSVNASTLPPEDSKQYHRIAKECTGLTDEQCFWTSGENRVALRGFPTTVNIPQFKAAVQKALAAIDTAQRTCRRKLQQAQLAAFIPQPKGSRAPTAFAEQPGNKFTVYINCDVAGVDSPLAQVVAHYASSPLVERVIVFWAGSQAPPDIGDLDVHPVPVHLHRDLLPSRSARFKPHPKLFTTQAVLLVDSNIIIPHAELAFTFSLWQQHPHQLVGFFAQTHSMLDVWEHPNAKFLAYSAISSRAAFVEVKYLTEFADNLPQEARDLIDGTSHCHEIVMAILVSHFTNEPGILVDSSALQVIGPHRHTTSAVVQEQAMCLRQMARILGYPPSQLPLLYSNVKVAPVKTADLEL